MSRSYVHKSAEFAFARNVFSLLCTLVKDKNVGRRTEYFFLNKTARTFSLHQLQRMSNE